MQDKIRPIYSELKGILSQAPSSSGYLHNDRRILWERLNELIKNLLEITQDEQFNSLIIQPAFTGDGETTVTIDEYRTKVSGLISRLHGTYFAIEDEPFSGKPSTIVSQTSTQSQNVSIQIYVELGMQIQKALEKADTPAEKSLVEKLKSQIMTVKSFVDFGLLLNSLASQYGISAERLKAIFGL